MKRLKISIVSSHDTNENDFKIQGLFKELIKELQAKFSQFPYDRADFINFTFNSEPEQIEQDCIASINPSKYLLCKQELGDKIIPVAAIKKAYQEFPYYPSFFIANKNSNIDSIRSKDIKTIYVVSKNSTSGYIAPIFKLWESGVIETANEKGIENKGWELKTVGSHKEIEQRILDDPYSIGATGQFTNQEKPQNALVKVLLRYYYLPQDVLVISRNLLSYKSYIEDWFNKIFAENSEWVSTFYNSSNRVTGLYTINEEFKNALKELEIMTGYVHNFNSRKKIDSNHYSSNQISKNLQISSRLKSLLADNKLETVINDLTDHFKALKNISALNEIIILDSNYDTIKKQEKLSLLKEEDLFIKRNRLNISLLSLIDDELVEV